MCLTIVQNIYFFTIIKMFYMKHWSNNFDKSKIHIYKYIIYISFIRLTFREKNPLISRVVAVEMRQKHTFMRQKHTLFATKAHPGDYFPLQDNLIFYNIITCFICNLIHKTYRHPPFLFVMTVKKKKVGQNRINMCWNTTNTHPIIWR